MKQDEEKSESFPEDKGGTNTESTPRRLRDLPPHERPQERLESLGATALADRELLAMLVRSGTSRKQHINST